ncbi:serine/threonine-protein kinase ATM-like isoform X1 [Primulina eburnea]|uniref:serine/threonine-protein kinase ATM-like isoform X1 n=1 Tax=Primulina eburnea TaxID=1245227 RepID=UPI003C6CB451
MGYAKNGLETHFQRYSRYRLQAIIRQGQSSRSNQEDIVSWRAKKIFFYMCLNHFSIMCGMSSKMFQVSNLSMVLSFAIFWKLHIIGFTCGNKFTPILYFCTWKRDEGKISRKLVECINTYLLKDEPNLGGKSLEIHQALNHFVFRYWFATHDRSLKCVLSELVDVMSKELDQMSTSSTNSPWGEKCGIMTSSQFKVAELGDLVFCQGDLQYLLDLRQNVLSAVLAILNLKEFTTLNERFVVLLPTTAFALSIGSAPLLYDASGLLPLLYATELVEELAKIEESPSDFLECSVEVLAKIDIDSGPKPVNFSNYCQNVRLPLNLRDQLFHEMENHVLECIKEVEIDKMLLSEVIYTCALLANFMFCSYSTSFLVSELVACCIPCGSNKKLSVTTSSRAVLLLQKLTIGAAEGSLTEFCKETSLCPSKITSLQVHSKGVNLELVRRLISNLQRKLTAESISIEDSNVDNFG